MKRTVPPEGRHVMMRILREARPFWPQLLVVLLLNLLGAGLLLLSPIPLRIAVDSVIGSHPLPSFVAPVVPHALSGTPTRLLLLAAGMQVLIAVAGQIQSTAATLVSARTAALLTASFRSRLLQHGQRLSLAYHDTRGTEDSLYRIQYDGGSLHAVAVGGVLSLCSSIVLVLAVLGAIVRVDLQLALVAVAVSPLLALYAYFYNRRMRAPHLAAKELESGAMAVVQETLGALRIVKAFGREHEEQARFDGWSRRSVDAHLRIALAETVFATVVNLTIAVGTAAILYVGIHRVQAGALTLGELLMIYAYLFQLYGPLQGIIHQTAALQSSMASARRAFDLLDQPADVADGPRARRLRRAGGAIEFDDVRFSYHSRRNAVDGVTFAVEPGERLGIAGRTGAGKSTLVSLLMRFYEPQWGRILLDGVDIRRYRWTDLRRQFALVLQEPVLFSTSIAENIAYGAARRRRAARSSRPPWPRARTGSCGRFRTATTPSSASAVFSSRAASASGSRSHARSSATRRSSSSTSRRARWTSSARARSSRRWRP
ncbi:MAG TPA: ABC transporter ATP-binding protein [Gaiellaceae bacterium]|nr:ABC transporter ATP-binding protein [Gaiellaceae bacterium]